MKDFIVIGNQNAITYKDIFPHLQKQQMWIGYNNVTDFISYYGGNGKVGCRWFTTLPVTDKDPLVLTARYSPEKYPKYDNYDAIEVGALKDIPFDYSGVMGVTISILDKYCPEQFEIVGYGCGNRGKEIGVRKNSRGRTDIEYFINGKRVEPFKRILIRKRNGKYLYRRLLIRRK